MIEDWADWPGPGLAPLEWPEAACRERWQQGLPLAAEALPPLDPAEVEVLLAPAMERLAGARPDAAEGLQRLAEAWDGGAVGPADLLPTRGRIGSGVAEQQSGLSAELVAFLAYCSLRPPLETYFAAVRPRLDAHVWELGICPFCGAPPGFSDVLEDGRRRLACHLCGAGWLFPRTHCPFCGSDRSRDLVRLEPEDRDQGYLVIGCAGCRAYLKELDRRVRWNGRSALVEDWGSPHLDLVALRADFWRPTPTLLGIARRG